jgi:hypothetical protein
VYTLYTLNSDLLEILLAPDLLECDYCLSRGVFVSTFESYCKMLAYFLFSAAEFAMMFTEFISIPTSMNTAYR